MKKNTYVSRKSVNDTEDFTNQKASPIQLNTIVFLHTTFKLDGEAEKHCKSMCWVSKANVYFTSAVNDCSAVSHKLQAILEKLWLHVRHVLKLFQGDGSFQQLPPWVIRKVGVDELVRVWQEEVLIKLVVELFCRSLFANDAACCPVCINKAPGAIDIDCIPRVLVLAW